TSLWLIVCPTRMVERLCCIFGLPLSREFQFANSQSFLQCNRSADEAQTKRNSFTCRPSRGFTEGHHLFTPWHVFNTQAVKFTTQSATTQTGSSAVFRVFCRSGVHFFT